MKLLLVWASWTLGVEMLFYLIFPLLFRFVSSTARAAVFVGVSLVFAASHDILLRLLLPTGYDFHKVRHLSLGHQLPVFAIGMLAFYVDEAWRRAGRPRVVEGRWLLLAGAAGFFSLPWVPAEARTGADLYVMAVVYAFILLGLSALPVAPIVNRLTAFLGTISYSLYLNHPQLILILSVRVFPKIHVSSETSIWRLLACLLLTFVILIPVSCLTYCFIELPGISFGSRMIRRKHLRRTNMPLPDISSAGTTTPPAL